MMLHGLKTFWHRVEGVMRALGNVMSSVFLTIFYFTIFALFALPVRAFANPFRRRGGTSNFVPPGKALGSLESLRDEF